MECMQCVCTWGKGPLGSVCNVCVHGYLYINVGPWPATGTGSWSSGDKNM